MKINIRQANILVDLMDTNDKRGIWFSGLSRKTGIPDATLHRSLTSLKEIGLVNSYKEKKVEGQGRTRVLYYLTDMGKEAVKRIAKRV